MTARAPAGAVLMCPPAHFVVRDVKNPFMDAERPIDRDLAGVQWKALQRAFAGTGLHTLAIEPVDDLEDMVFTANQVFVAGGDEPFVIPSRMRYASREREVPYFVAWFRACGYEIRELDLSGDYLEGHGDLLWHPERPLVWAGFGYRSSRGGVERFADAMRPHGVAVEFLELRDPTFYHLDTCFCALGPEAALYYPGAFAPDAIERLKRIWPRLHEVSREAALRFTCNGVAVNGRFVCSFVSPAVAEILAREGLQPLRVDLSEFEKAGGSAFCMKTFVDAVDLD